MKNILLFTFLLLGSILSAQPAFRGCHHAEHGPKRLLSAAEQAVLQAALERSDTIDILDYDITLSVIDFTNQRIYGNCAVRFTPNMNNVQLLPLDLLKMQIDSVTGFGANLSYTYDSLYLGISLPTAMNIGDTATITVWYQGHPTPDGSWGGFKFDGQYAYNQGIGLTSNPVNMGRSWFPCFDNFVERATVGIKVYTKLPRKAYAVGTFLGESVYSNDTILRAYRMNQPLPTYLTNVAVSDYAQVDYTHNALNGQLPFQLVARGADTSSMRGTFIQLGDAVDALESWWGPYWWERVGYIATPQGAMEHPTNITFPRSIAVGGNTVGHQDLMSHELGHCWWGDVVTLKTASDMWIKEGNAEYSAHLFSEYINGHQVFIDKVKNNFKDVLRTAHFDDGGYQALSGMPFAYTYGTHTYYKGAAMLHNMRTYLGDSLFRVGQKAVLNNNAYSAINAAEYRDGLSAATGVDMSDFFNAWIFAPGYSAFEVNEVQAQPNGGNVDLTVIIEQKLRGATVFHNKVPLEITFYDNNWNQQTIKTMVSGQLDTIQTSIGFNPIAWTVNKGHTLNLAQFHNDLNITAPISNLTIPFVDVVLSIPTVADSFNLAVDHYWVGPDPIQSSSAYISSTHYWKVDGTFDEFVGTLRLDYNKSALPQFDQDLVSITEDSLILVYRPGPQFDWKEYPYYTKINLFNSTDGTGLMRVDTIWKGEYAFANGDLPEWVAGTSSEAPAQQTIKLYPNPAQQYFTIEGTGNFANNMIRIELFDLQGQLVYEEQFQTQGDKFQHQVNLNPLAAGIYWLKMSDNKGILIDAQALGVTK